MNRALAVDNNLDDLIEISPDEIEAGVDEQGLPITKPAATAVAKPKPEPKKKEEPVVSLAQLEAARLESQRLAKARDDAEAAARAAQEQLEANRALLDRTERDLHDRTRQGVAAHYASIDAQLSQVLAGIDSSKMERDSAKRELAMVMADENLSAQEKAQRIADANERIATAAAHLTQLDSGRAALQQELQRAQRAWQDVQAEPPARKDEPNKQEPRAKEAGKPQERVTPTAEQFIAASPPETQPWLKAHPEFATPGTKQHRQVMRFVDEWLESHDDKVDSLNSQAFVKALDAKFFPDPDEEEADEVAEEDNKEEAAEAPAAAEQQPPAKRIPTAAPVSRSAAPGRPSSGVNSIKLTQEQHAIAPDLYPTLEDLAPEVQAKFKVWSPTAARFQYHHDLQRAKKDGKDYRLR